MVVFDRLQYNEEYLYMLRSLKTMSGSRLFLFKYLIFRFSETLHVSSRGVNSLRFSYVRKHVFECIFLSENFRGFRLYWFKRLPRYAITLSGSLSVFFVF